MATQSRKSETPLDKPLTPKQEKFAQGVASGKTQADAYRAAYDAAKSKPPTVQVHASKLMAIAKVATRVRELQAVAAEKHQMGVGDILKELEEARTVAMTGKRPQASAMVAATMGKAKVLGFASDKVVHSGDAANPIQHNHTITFGRRK